MICVARLAALLVAATTNGASAQHAARLFTSPPQNVRGCDLEAVGSSSAITLYNTWRFTGQPARGEFAKIERYIPVGDIAGIRQDRTRFGRNVDWSGFTSPADTFEGMTFDVWLSYELGVPAGLGIGYDDPRATIGCG